MQLEMLRTFVEVARGRTVAEVAEEQAITQPSATGRIQSLEKELDARLFSMNRRAAGRGYRLELTEAGQAFLPYAESALSAVEAGREAVKVYRELTAQALAAIAS